MHRFPKFMIAVGFAAMSFVVLPATAGAAGCYTGCTPSTVSGTAVTPTTTSGQPSKGTSVTSVPNGSSALPFTGADIVGLGVLGAGAVVIGAVVMRRRSRIA
ncbi:MAG: hypothetical protein ABSB09_03280 [Acidimicrobiales bacterium]|jgi:hypothetical protein